MDAPSHQFSFLLRDRFLMPLCSEFGAASSNGPSLEGDFVLHFFLQRDRCDGLHIDRRA
jgi:hypothetical protein